MPRNNRPEEGKPSDDRDAVDTSNPNAVDDDDDVQGHSSGRGYQRSHIDDEALGRGSTEG